ncbi:MAG: hypothetical protein JO189_21340 [Deltaproteobacteria bacterium]|nr:hypothetical protein [Deltaproteobacteria bacterium]
MRNCTQVLVYGADIALVHVVISRPRHDPEQRWRITLPGTHRGDELLKGHVRWQSGIGIGRQVTGYNPDEAEATRQIMAHVSHRCDWGMAGA